MIEKIRTMLKTPKALKFSKMNNSFRSLKTENFFIAFQKFTEDQKCLNKPRTTEFGLLESVE